MKDKIASFFNRKEKEVGSYYEPEMDVAPLTSNSNKEMKLLRKENAQLKKNLEKQALDKFKTRRSIRKYAPKKIDEEVVYNILEGSLNAPAAGNLQNTSIIVVNDSQKKEKISQIALQQHWISEAPTVLVIVRNDNYVQQMYPHDGTRYSIQNTAAVIENILMLSHFYGLGACWVEACENEVLKEYLGIPTGREVDAIIPIGFPLESPKVDKEPLMQHVFFEKHGNKNGNLS